MFKRRPKFSVFIATSVDGFIAKSNGDVDWLQCVDSPGEDYGFHDFFASVDTVILGRHSYEKAINYDPWPYEGKRVVVLSHTLTSVKAGVELASQNPSELAEKLSAEGVEHAYVDGGVTICHFINHKLIDEMTLSIVPILLGSGIKLFDQIPEMACELIYSKAYDTGLVQCQYLPMGAPAICP